jgi:hypothetical protein
VLSLLVSDGADVQEITANYFRTIHLWFPVISRRRLDIGIPLWQAGPDLAALFLTMRLITSVPERGAAPSDGELYRACKRYLSLLETSGMVSLLHLQSMLLVALFEYSHAVYPAAWMTVGACARYADMLGLPGYNEATIVLGPAVRTLLSAKYYPC